MCGPRWPAAGEAERWRLCENGAGEDPRLRPERVLDLRPPAAVEQNGGDRDLLTQGAGPTHAGRRGHFGSGVLGGARQELAGGAAAYLKEQSPHRYQLKRGPQRKQPEDGGPN
ncbi:hypothetical protein NDU88_002114 [Pleurodeles waltl]|uniref:Uncharacterized protein n=1 Tax=Pleurodeles waltl TaxID=8319 RepID=A0AAV7SDZ8_PLEWA|nr:hypothetical protein NDU88_002114 [Pleurodeles waltl]